MQGYAIVCISLQCQRCSHDACVLWAGGLASSVGDAMLLCLPGLGSSFLCPIRFSN